MSSVSSSDRARYDERIRQMREEHENREAENAKRRKAEVARLNEKHAQEVEDLKENFSERTEGLKERNRETLTRRDYENQQKIDDVRQIYRESLRKKMDDSETAKRSISESYEGALAKQKQISDAQKQNLLTQLNEEIGGRDEQYTQSLEEMREQSRAVIEANARKLNQSHEKEKSAIVSGHQDEMGRKHRMNTESRKAYESTLNMERMRRESDSKAWNQKYSDAVHNFNSENADNIKARNLILGEERAAIQDKYQSALDEKSSLMDMQNEKFRETVNDRLNSQVRSRDSQIQRLKGQLNSEMANNSRIRGLERENLARDFQRRVEILEDQKDNTVEKMKDLSADRVNTNLKKSEDIHRQIHRDHRSQMSVVTTKHREDRENLLAQQEQIVNHTKDSADSRVKKIVDLTNKNQEQLSSHYADSLD